jgi:hypothetical protein
MSTSKIDPRVVIFDWVESKPSRGFTFIQEDGEEKWILNFYEVGEKISRFSSDWESHTLERAAEFCLGNRLWKN